MDESSLLSKFDSLVESGVVQYDDNQQIIEHIDGDLKLHFVLTSALARKPTITTTVPKPEENSEPQQKGRDGSDINTAGFEIGNVGSAHFLAVNKFCFARPHLMLLTSDGRRKQYEPLDEQDLAAAWTALTAVDSDYVVFFNCGRDGGCSRLHKHMQLMPKPEYSFASFLDTKRGKEPNVPFHWFYHRLESQNVTFAELTKAYTDLLEQATSVGQGLSEHADSAPPGAACPHNLIFTKRWMVLVPRRRAGINKEVATNALGMLGVLAVATRDQVDSWLQLGTIDTLRELGVPK